jgi:hypothetical protein
MVPIMLDDNKNDTKCTLLESTKLDAERSKREDRSPPLTSSMTASQYNQFMNEANEYMENGCGALNSQETD